MDEVVMGTFLEADEVGVPFTDELGCFCHRIELDKEVVGIPREDAQGSLGGFWSVSATGDVCEDDRETQYQGDDVCPSPRFATGGGEQE